MLFALSGSAFSVSVSVNWRGILGFADISGNWWYLAASASVSPTECLVCMAQSVGTPFPTSAGKFSKVLATSHIFSSS